MAASDELTDALRVGRRRLEELGPQVRVLDDWARVEAYPRYWRIGLELTPTDLAACEWIPAATRWQFLVERTYPRGDIAVHPARDGGITATFPHQRPNDDEGHHWREGKICTSESVSGYPLAIARSEPRDSDNRLAWHVCRALDWLRAASRSELLKPGDPFELPVYADGFTDIAIAFSESPAALQRWQGRRERHGLAELVTVNAGKTQYVVRTFQGSVAADVMRPDWGLFITNAPAALTTPWLRLDKMPYAEPWAAPHTWGELRTVLAQQGRDFNTELKPLAELIRDGWTHYLLVGFPIPNVVGGPASHLHWIAAKIPALDRSSKETPVNGFRVRAARWIADVTPGGVLADGERIRWVETANWHADQLATRGRWTGALRGTVAVIGCGTLGSALANLLVRGGTTELILIDHERLVGRNLVRHELGMRELRGKKASELARRLNSVAPNATVLGYDADVRTLEGDAAEHLDAVDVVIDTTGSDEVLDALAARTRKSDGDFASISLSYGADHLYLFAARGRSLPVAAFRSLFAPWLEADAPELDTMTWEGTGCWNPIFPARADDVASHAALAAKQLDALLGDSFVEPELRVFERAANATMSRIWAPR